MFNSPCRWYDVNNWRDRVPQSDYSFKSIIDKCYRLVYGQQINIKPDKNTFHGISSCQPAKC